MLLAIWLYYRMCSTDVYCSKQLAALLQRSIPIICSGIDESVIGQNLWRRRNVVKTETQQTFVNGLLGFITLGIYTPLEARVYCSQ